VARSASGHRDRATDLAGVVATLDVSSARKPAAAARVDLVEATVVSTFTVRPPRNGLDVFLENLKKDPAIAAFIQ
jgi:hypothetical protein